MDAVARLELIRRLCSFEGRWPGTDAERRAANDLAARLEAMGRRVEVQPTYVFPEYALVHAAHMTLAVAASLLGVFVPVAGFALALAVTVSMYGDLSTRFYLLRRLFFRRASQNVVSPGSRPEAPARLVLTAHYDAARTGLVFNPGSVERSARMQRRLPFVPGPFFALFWPLALLLVALGARMAGFDATAVSIVQLVPTITSIVGVPLLLDIALSDIVPGANDNASGVATVISLADELGREPPANLDLWVVLPGAEETLMEGMHHFLRRNARDWDRAGTYFVNVDTVGYGAVRYVTAEGFVVMYEFDRRLVELCGAIAETGGDAYPERAEPLRHRLGSDALPARLAGFPSIMIGCLNERGFPPDYHQPTDTPDRIDPAALDRAHDFLLELIRRIDADVGRRAG